MFEREEGYFRGFNDFELFYQSWVVERPKGTILITHGLGEHSECYQRLVEGLAPLEMNFFGWDLRGHGRSEGKRGVSRDFFDYCEDFKAFVTFVKKNHKNGPFFILGHSMGGLVTNRALMEFGDIEHDGLILSSPLCGIALRVPKFKELGGNLAAKLLPDLTLHNEISYSQLSRDRSVLSEYEHDHLRHDKISTKLFVDIVKTCDYVMDHAVQISCPLLVVQAGHDTVVSVNATRDFYSKVSSSDKEFQLYEGYYHEVFNDLGREKAYSDLMTWIGHHSK